MLNIESEQVSLDVLDTSGQDEYTALREVYVRSADAFVVCVPLTASQALQDAQPFIEFVIHARESQDMYDTPIVVAGTKCDLADQRQVQSSDLQQFASKYGATCIETSAKWDKNVNEAFEMCAKAAYSQRKLAAGQKTKHVGQKQVTCNVQ